MTAFAGQSGRVRLKSRDGVRRITIVQTPGESAADFQSRVKFGRQGIANYEEQKKASKRIRGRGNK